MERHGHIHSRPRTSVRLRIRVDNKVLNRGKEKESHHMTILRTSQTISDRHLSEYD